MELLILAFLFGVPLWVAYWFFKVFGDILLGLVYTIAVIWFFLWLIT